MKIKPYTFKGIVIETDHPKSDVPCGTCIDCCSKLAPFLSQAEFESGKYAYTFVNIPNSQYPAIAVPKAMHGGCMYLVNNQCSIYNDRPLACRQFDCRNPETSHPKVSNKFEDKL
jgi:Fe-S-cluster containining protein